MLPQQTMRPVPPNTIRRFVINNPLRVTIHSKLLYDCFISPIVPWTNIISESILNGYKTELEVELWYDDFLQCGKEYKLPKDRFITYEESDLDWLIYTKQVIPKPLDIIETNEITVILKKEGQQIPTKTVLNGHPIFYHKDNRVSIPLLVIN